MYRAIVVDDEEIIVDGLCRLMPWQKYGCEVVGRANDGRQALEIIREVKPHILFTDIRMPGIDGLSLIAALRSEFPDMQVAILSGYSDFDYAREAINLGVLRYLTKPSKMAELEEALCEMAKNLEAAGKEQTQPQVNEENGESASNFIIKNAMAYIEQNYAQKLSLPEVAEKVYVSQWHLSKLLTKNTGQSFSEILNNVRIEKAKELLVNSGLRVWEISERVGFGDVTHFSRIFKKQIGQSPNEYREKQVSG